MYRDEVSLRPKITGMKLVIELLHSQYRSVIYTNLELVIKSASFSHSNQIEILTIKVGICIITLVCKPLNIISLSTHASKILLNIIKTENGSKQKCIWDKISLDLGKELRPEKQF